MWIHCVWYTLWTVCWLYFAVAECHRKTLNRVRCQCEYTLFDTCCEHAVCQLYFAVAGTSPLLGHFTNDREGTKNITTTKQLDVNMNMLRLMPAVCQLYFAAAECHPFWAVSLMTESKLFKKKEKKSQMSMWIHYVWYLLWTVCWLYFAVAECHKKTTKQSEMSMWIYCIWYLPWRVCQFYFAVAECDPFH